MSQSSALKIVNRALQEIGLPQVATIVSAQDDETGFQALGLLNALGAQLIKVHDWQFLEGTVNIVANGIDSSFDLPDDYKRIVNQTQWASKNKRPMYGPMTAQGWSWVQFGIVSVGVYYRYRILGNKFVVFPTPTAGEELNFFYIKKDWVWDPILMVYKGEVENDTDEPIFEDYLLTAGVKFKLWAAKGMEASELGREFEYMLSTEKAQNQGAPVIQLDKRWDYLYISGQNVPDGSWNV
jgi:hypothetical protein